MPLPDWAQPPEPGFDHGDNYSVLEVVWTHPDGRVVVQVPPEPVDVDVEALLVEEAPAPRRRFARRRAR